MRRLDISVREGIVDIFLDWYGSCCSLSETFSFGALAELWEACWGSFQRRGCEGLGQEKIRSINEILYWDWFVES